MVQSQSLAHSGDSYLFVWLRNPDGGFATGGESTVNAQHKDLKYEIMVLKTLSSKNTVSDFIKKGLKFFFEILSFVHIIKGCLRVEAGIF